MSHLFQVDCVKLLCSCGMKRPVTAVYLCRHCLKLRCGSCVSHEVDTMFCPNCLENMPSTEAKLKRNRCRNCFDCPSCGHTMTTRASSVQVSSSDDPATPTTKKVYYLGCTACRWTTRDVGLEDQGMATGGWVEQDNPHYSRIQDLFEYFRNIAHREKLETERLRNPKRKSTYLGLTDKHFYSYSSLSRKSLNSSFSSKIDTSSLDLKPAEPVEDVPGVPKDIFSEAVSLCSVSTIEQRLASPEWQPETTSLFYPVHKHILAKHSHRCRHCEHNLSKPEYNPSSVKFKIQLGVYYHVPEVRLVHKAQPRCGVEETIQLSLCNPTPRDMTVTLLPFIPDIYEAQQEKDAGEPPTSLSSGASLVRVIEIPKERTDWGQHITADVVLPQGQMTLARRDDTAEYDDTDSASSYSDDPQVVRWRRANKVGVNVTVTPKAGAQRAVFAFILRFDFTNTVAAAPESRTVTLNVPVIIDLGKVSE